MSETELIAKLTVNRPTITNQTSSTNSQQQNNSEHTEMDIDILQVIFIIY